MTSCTVSSPVGELCICADDEGLISLSFGSGGNGENEIIRKTVRELSEYFAGERKSFDIPLKPSGTDFQRRVWAELARIPYGETRSYADIAAAVGNKNACRAVGMANNRNPIAIIIPCHRVIGKNGTLTGYAGGLSVKQYLLELENLNRVESGEWRVRSEE